MTFSDRKLKSIKTACQITAKTFIEIKELIRPGLTEKAIAWKINLIMKDLGAECLAFRTIVASGPGSAEPHHKNTTRKIGKNDIVLLDFGCKINGFCSDFSRTIFIGRPKPEWLKIHQIVKTSQQLAINHLRNTPGIKASFLDKICRDYITKKGYGKYFIHGLGHGIGSRVHQYFHISPKSKAVIKTGSVFTIEPGIYLKGRFGVRIEDTVWLNFKGLQVLTSENQ